MARTKHIINYTVGEGMFWQLDVYSTEELLYILNSFETPFTRFKMPPILLLSHLSFKDKELEKAAVEALSSCDTIKQAIEALSCYYLVSVLNEKGGKKNGRKKSCI